MRKRYNDKISGFTYRYTKSSLTTTHLWLIYGIRFIMQYYRNNIIDYINDILDKEVIIK